MKDFLDIVIFVILLYIGIEFSLTYLYRKIKWALRDKDAIIEEERMRYEGTFDPKNFYRMRDKLKRQGYQTEGIYIFTNKNNRKSYVGQSVDLLRRTNEHLSGRGNQGVHEDMLRGHKFTLKYIKLSETNFRDLDSLEKHYITKYNSYHRGYNKTRGNG